MRELKFRAWHENKKIMFSPNKMGAEQLTLSPDGRGFINVHSNSTEKSEYYPHLIPMQYTGIKDKNGKEIYEEDILEHNDDDCYDNGKYSSVSFYRGVFHVSIRYDFMPIPLFDGPFVYKPNVKLYEKEKYNWLEEWKIAGNIYETPELLKKAD